MRKNYENDEPEGDCSDIVEELVEDDTSRFRVNFLRPWLKKGTDLIKDIKETNTLKRSVFLDGNL